MDHLANVVCGPRPGRMRDRRGHGLRGPLALPGPLSASRSGPVRTARTDFDGLVTEVLTALRREHAAALDLIEVAVEEAPLLPQSWTGRIPLSTVVADSSSIQLVVFRQPIDHRASDQAHLAELVWSTMLEAFATLWGTDPDDLDPRPAF